MLNRPADETDDGKPVVFYDIDKELTLPLEDICTDKGKNYTFALKVANPGWYRVIVTGYAEGGELAQVPLTLFSMGTASGTFTWRGNGIPTSFRKKIPMFSRFTTFRLFFAQTGLHLESIRFELYQAGMKIELLGNPDD